MAASPDFVEIINRLPRLSTAELRLVVQQAGKLIGAAPGVTSSPPAGDWLGIAICEELKRRGLLPPKSRPEWRPKDSTTYNQVCETLLRGVPRDLTPPELLSLGAMAARVLADDLQYGPAPLCLPVMMQNLARLPGAIDKQFPGYLRNRLLGWTIGITRRDDGDDDKRNPPGPAPGVDPHDPGRRR